MNIMPAHVSDVQSMGRYRATLSFFIHTNSSRRSIRYDAELDISRGKMSVTAWNTFEDRFLHVQKKKKGRTYGS